QPLVQRTRSDGRRSAPPPGGEDPRQPALPSRLGGTADGRRRPARGRPPVVGGLAFPRSPPDGAKGIRASARRDLHGTGPSKHRGGAFSLPQSGRGLPDQPGKTGRGGLPPRSAGSAERQPLPLRSDRGYGILASPREAHPLHPTRGHTF